MLSGAQIAKIKADIAWLERCRHGCVDSGIRELIESWIQEQKDKLQKDKLKVGPTRRLTRKNFKPEARPGRGAVW
jgi:hypothetical protein